jgi:hypothetical protein
MIRKGEGGTTAPPTIHEATIPSSFSGIVYKKAILSKEAAIARRMTGLDVVVCGADQNANRKLAREIEEGAVGVGGTVHHPPHPIAGHRALPHYQARVPPPKGHCFYEHKLRKASKHKT